jgi:FMN phosphatase YigB (HAD superfamily)
VKPSARIVGVDLDNTIICYDQAFHRAAIERGWIDPATPAAKTAVKKSVVGKVGDRAWTELQGFVYGPGLDAATAYPGAAAFFAECAGQGIRTVIISHKTQYAAAGPRYDLREAAAAWLKSSGLFNFADDSVVFTDTRAAKLDAVRKLGCQTLIDDLPEVFRDPSYPRETDFILFDPDQAHPDWTATPRAASWAEISSRFFS